MNAEERNARIESTRLGLEDHGIPSFMVMTNSDGICQGFGGYDLRFYGIKPVLRICEVVGAAKWEDLEGMYCRVRRGAGKLSAIGHIIKDEWYDVEAEGPSHRDADEAG